MLAQRLFPPTPPLPPGAGQHHQATADHRETLSEQAGVGDSCQAKISARVPHPATPTSAPVQRLLSCPHTSSQTRLCPMTANNLIR